MAIIGTMAQLLEAYEGYEDCNRGSGNTANILRDQHGLLILSKAVIAKVGTSSSTPAVSSDVAELNDLVRAFSLDKKISDPGVPLILGMVFSENSRALIDVYEGERNTRKRVLGFSGFGSIHDILLVLKLIRLLCSDGDFPHLESILVTMNLPNTDSKIKENVYQKHKDSNPNFVKPKLLNSSDVPAERKVRSDQWFLIPQESHRLEIIRIQGINPEFVTHNSNGRGTINSQFSIREVFHPKIHDVIKIMKLKNFLTAGLIYLLSDSPWVSNDTLVMPKKGGFVTVVQNEENVLIHSIGYPYPGGVDTICVLNGGREKSPFYGPKRGIVSSGTIKFLKYGIEVDYAKIDVCAKFLIPHTA
ncbi:hypothetical protein Tco_0545078 [Tanacetum coccineum]